MNREKYTQQFAKAVDKNIKKMSLITKITVCALAALMVALVITLIVDVAGMTIEYTLEAGDELPSAARLSGRAGAEYDFGNEKDDFFKEPGEYEIYIIDGSRRITVKITVEDTIAPRVELLELYVNQNGPFPAAIDFFKDIKDASEVTAKFKNAVNPKELGEYEILLEISDKYGNGSKKEYKTKMTLIVDTEAPTISGPDAITGYVGEGIAYLKAVEVTDNCFGEVDIQVDSSGVNTDKAGSYTVK